MEPMVSRQEVRDVCQAGISKGNREPVEGGGTLVPLGGGAHKANVTVAFTVRSQPTRWV